MNKIVNQTRYAQKLRPRFKSSRNFGGYVIGFILPVIFTLAPLTLSYVFLVNSGETLSGPAAATIQLKNDVNFSQALFYRPEAYKIAMTKEIRPRVLILGSSRVMQFIQQPWKVSAYNAGGALDSAEALKNFSDEALKDYKPETIILGIDWWWFSEDYKAEPQPQQNELSLKDLAAPYKWWERDRISVAMLLQSFADQSFSSGIGIGARHFFAGWTPFGNYHYGLALTASAEASDEKFSRTLKAVSRGTKQKKDNISISSRFDEERWEKFSGVVKSLTSSGMNVLLLVPPVSPPLADFISKQPTPNLVTDLRQHLLELSMPLFDFHDPHSVDSSSCEFVDGLHGGEVTALRMLKAIANQDSALFAQYVDLGVINIMINQFSGRAAIRDTRSAAPEEVDFLNIGCNKSVLAVQ